MDLITENLLTILILLPVFGALLTLGHSLFWKQESSLKWVTLGFTLINFLISLLMLGTKTLSANGFYFEKNIPWIKAINTNYHLGVDGNEFVARDFDDVYYADCRTFDVARRRKARNGILCFFVAARKRDARRIYVARSARVLFVF